ncbi:TlpA family protein disulfide reductase [Nibricoccus aquaticus]|nr:TlpA disulfide reductase family protein [Nibricoccus aquaticus]
MNKNSLRAFLFVALGALLGFVVTACNRSDATPSTPSRPSAYKALPAANPAPVWALTDLDGKTLNSADFKGKILVVDFWATWCPPCVHEIPGYIDFVKKHGTEKIALVGLSLDEIPAADVKKFATAKGINYPVAIAPQELLAQFASVEGIPATFIVDRDGKLRFMKVGSAPIEDLEKTVAGLL